MNKKEFNALLQKYQEGRCTAEEERFLETTFFSAQSPEHSLDSSNPFKQEVWKRLVPMLQQPRSIRIYRYYAAVAAVICLLGGAALIWQQQLSQTDNTNVQNAVNPAPTDDIVPSANAAILTLENGKQIALDKDKDGLVMRDSGLTYMDASKVAMDQSSASAANSWLALYTPAGSPFRVVMSDGTTVTLNAGSRLRYPQKFAGNKRIVYLEGEAFFQVNEVHDSRNATKKIPFIVRSGNQEVLVVGTRFNVDAYDGRIKTTLVSGKVVVESDAGMKLALRPTEQSVNTGSNLTKQRVDLDQELAWLDNRFSFDNKSLKQIMDELSRWYDLDVKYLGNIPQVSLRGDAYRNQNLKLVLRVLDAAGVEYILDASKRKLVIKGN